MIRLLMLILLTAGVAHAGDLPTPCADYIPFGMPVTTGHPHTTLACRIGYLAQVDGDTLQPDWVAWTLTPERAIGGCVERTNPFHADEQLPPGFYANPGDYAKSGYDLGHLSGYEDNAVSPAMGRDSFDVPTNFSPQVSRLNRLEWEALEQDTRAWTMTKGDLVIIDGPIFAGPAKSIGLHHIAVPSAFFKVIIAPAETQALAVIMTNATHPKGPLVPFMVSIADIERVASITIPVPDGVDKIHASAPWDADTAGFAKAKKAACAMSIAQK